MLKKHANLFIFPYCEYWIIPSNIFVVCLTLFAFLVAGQASKSGNDVLLDLLSIGSPSAESSSSTVDILSSNSSNKAPVSSSLDGLSSLSLSTKTTSNAAPMMNLLDGFAPSPPTGCKLCLAFGHYHWMKYSQSIDSLSFLILSRKQWIGLSISNCIWEQLLEVDIQFLKTTRKPTNNSYPGYFYEFVLQFIYRFCFSSSSS